VQLREAHAKRSHAAMELLKATHNLGKRKRKRAPRAKAKAKSSGRRPGFAKRAHKSAKAAKSKPVVSVDKPPDPDPSLDVDVTPLPHATDWRVTPTINPRDPSDAPTLADPSGVTDSHTTRTMAARLPGNCIEDRSDTVPCGCTLRKYLAADGGAYWKATLPTKPSNWIDSANCHSRSRSWEGHRAKAHTEAEAFAMCQEWVNDWGDAAHAPT